MPHRLLAISNQFLKFASGFTPVVEALHWETTWVNLTPDDFQFLVLKISQDEELSRFGAQCLDKLADWSDTSRKALFGFVFDLKKFEPDKSLHDEIKRFLSQFKKYLTNLEEIKKNYPDVFAAIKAMMGYLKFCGLYHGKEEIPIDLYALISYSTPNQIAENFFRHLNTELSENGLYEGYSFYFQKIEFEIDKILADDDELISIQSQMKQVLEDLHQDLIDNHSDKNFDGFVSLILSFLRKSSYKITREDLHNLIVKKFDLSKDFSSPDLDYLFLYLESYQSLFSFKENIKNNKNEFIRIICNLQGKLVDKNNLQKIFSKYSPGLLDSSNHVTNYLVPYRVLGYSLDFILNEYQKYRDKIKQVQVQKNPITSPKTEKDLSLLTSKKMVEKGFFDWQCLVLINSKPLNNSNP